MISKIKIQNFKSISELEFEIGRFNVLIGENGCGKSNILEAIAFGSAASANQLERQFLASRGIRVSKPELLRAGFNKSNLNKEIKIVFETSNPINRRIRRVAQGQVQESVIIDKITKLIEFRLQNSNKVYSDWFDSDKVETSKDFPKFLKTLFLDKGIESIKGLKNEEINKIITLRSLLEVIPVENVEDIFKSEGLQKIAEEQYLKDKFDSSLAGFTIYSPENSFLRKFEDEEKIQPLGIKGEGLFKLIKVFSLEKNQPSLKLLKNYLHLIDWFEDFNIPEQAFEGEKIINLRDKFIQEQLFIQQHNANEGFLFLLFYLSLFISKDTPSFFAIDNIESSFNPRLCSEITKVTNELSAKKGKQVILTTHNPYVLDGLDLADDNQRLFVVRRNAEGKTILKRILPNKSTKKLSEAWMLGYLGGLPSNF